MSTTAKQRYGLGDPVAHKRICVDESGGIECACDMAEDWWDAYGPDAREIELREEALDVADLVDASYYEDSADGS